MFRQPGPSFLHISRGLKQQLTHLLLYFLTTRVQSWKLIQLFWDKGFILTRQACFFKNQAAESCCQPDIFGLDGLLHSWFVCAEPPAHPVNVSSLQLDRKWHLFWCLSFNAASCARCSNEVVQQKEKWGGVTSRCPMERLQRWEQYLWTLMCSRLDRTEKMPQQVSSLHFTQKPNLEFLNYSFFN